MTGYITDPIQMIPYVITIVVLFAPALCKTRKSAAGSLAFCTSARNADQFNRKQDRHMSVLFFLLDIDKPTRYPLYFFCLIEGVVDADYGVIRSTS